MDIDYTRAKQIILTDRKTPYKPDKRVLRRLSGMFPDVCVFGFVKYYEGFWSILAQSESFPINVSFPQGAVTFETVVKWSQGLK